MSSFSKRVYDAGWKALIARRMRYKDVALEAQEEQRLLYLHATDAEIDEIVKASLEKSPWLKEVESTVSAWFMEMRERARDQQAWHAQYHVGEP